MTRKEKREAEQWHLATLRLTGCQTYKVDTYDWVWYSLPVEGAQREGAMSRRVETVSMWYWIAVLFTVGFMGLGFWKTLLAFVIWPYYLGVAAARLVWE